LSAYIEYSVLETMKYSFVAAVLVQTATTVDASAIELDKRLNNGLGLTPPMGWSSWVSFSDKSLQINVC
jgi:hypothetical protein